MKITIKQLQELAKKAGVPMWYHSDLKLWRVRHPTIHWVYFGGRGRENLPHKRTVYFILRGIIAHNEDSLNKGDT